MKKTIILLLIFLVALSVYAQLLLYHILGVHDFSEYIPSFVGDLFEGDRPTDKLNSTWICKEENSYFTVSEDENGKRIATGKMRGIPGRQSVELEFLGNSSNTVNVYVQLQEGIRFKAMTGTCIFKPKKIVINIDEKTDGIWSGYVDIAVFIKQ